MSSPSKAPPTKVLIKMKVPMPKPSGAPSKSVPSPAAATKVAAPPVAAGSTHTTPKVALAATPPTTPSSSSNLPSATEPSPSCGLPPKATPPQTATAAPFEAAGGKTSTAASPPKNVARKSSTPVATPVASAAQQPQAPTIAGPASPLGAKRSREDEDASAQQAGATAKTSAHASEQSLLRRRGLVTVPSTQTDAAKAPIAAERAYFDFDAEHSDDDEYEIVTEKVFVRIPLFDNFIDLGFDRQLDVLRDRFRMCDLETRDPKMYFAVPPSAAMNLSKNAHDGEAAPNSQNDSAKKDGASVVLTSSHDAYFEIKTNGERRYVATARASATTASPSTAPLYRKVQPSSDSERITAAFIGRWQGAERRLSGLTDQVVCSLVRPFDADGESGDMTEKEEAADMSIPSVFSKDNSKMASANSKRSDAEEKRKKYAGNTLHRHLTTAVDSEQNTRGWFVESVVPVKTTINMTRVL